MIDSLTDAGQLHAYIAKKRVYCNVETPEEYLEAESYFNERNLSEQVPK